jgi:hypothetical protein
VIATELIRRCRPRAKTIFTSGHASNRSLPCAGGRAT